MLRKMQKGPTRPFCQLLNVFTVFQMANWPQNWRFCIFDLHFAKYLPIIANFRASTTYICLAKFISCIFSHVQPFNLPIYGLTVFQMSNWPQNLRFCIFDLHFAQNVSLLQLSEPLQPTYVMKSTFLKFFSLWNHLICPFQDLLW